MEGTFETQVRQRAYELWLRSGMVEGRDREHWLAAESELSVQRQAAVVEVAPALPARSKPKAKARSKKARA